jgi:hypothetical protein
VLLYNRGGAVTRPPTRVLYSHEIHWNRVGVRVLGSADAASDSTAESNYRYAQ